jgi:hypothetical protein
MFLFWELDAVASNPKRYVYTITASPTIFVSVPSIMESIAMGVFLY